MQPFTPKLENTPFSKESSATQRSSFLNSWEVLSKTILMYLSTPFDDSEERSRQLLTVVSADIGRISALSRIPWAALGLGNGGSSSSASELRSAGGGEDGTEFDLLGGGNELGSTTAPTTTSANELGIFSEYFTEQELFEFFEVDQFTPASEWLSDEKVRKMASKIERGRRGMAASEVLSCLGSSVASGAGSISAMGEGNLAGPAMPVAGHILPTLIEDEMTEDEKELDESAPHPESLSSSEHLPLPSGSEEPRIPVLVGTPSSPSSGEEPGSCSTPANGVFIQKLLIAFAVSQFWTHSRDLAVRVSVNPQDFAGLPSVIQGFSGSTLEEDAHPRIGGRGQSGAKTEAIVLGRYLAIKTRVRQVKGFLYSLFLEGKDSHQVAATAPSFPPSKNRSRTRIYQANDVFVDVDARTVDHDAEF